MEDELLDDFLLELELSLLLLLELKLRALDGEGVGDEGPILGEWEGAVLGNERGNDVGAMEGFIDGLALGGFVSNIL